MSTPHSRDPRDRADDRAGFDRDDQRYRDDSSYGAGAHRRDDDRYLDRDRDGRDDRTEAFHHDRDRDGRDDRTEAFHHDRDLADRPAGGYDTAAVIDPRAKVAAEQERYGGVKPGAAFFGWLSATGMSVLLTALLVAAGAAVGVATNTDLEEAAGDATGNPEGVGAAGVIGLAVILFISYYCGGYVAGRMARFQGARQGVAVWVWALVIAAVVALLGFIAGSEFNVLQQINGFPRIPVDEGTLSSAGIVTLVVALLVSLAGAILGGIAGVRYHRKVDRAGLVDTV